MNQPIPEAARREHLQALVRLADRYGIRTSYRDGMGQMRQAGAEALLRILHSLGADLGHGPQAALLEHEAEHWERPVDPVLVAWGGDLLAEIRLPAGHRGGLLWRLSLEDGGHRENACPLDDLDGAEVATQGGRYRTYRLAMRRLPLGYHRLAVHSGEHAAEALVIAAPLRAWVPKGLRAWGVFSPTYALHSADGPGVGTFTELQRLTEWVHGLGGSVVATLPMLATFLDEPFDPSPYAPVSRLFWNELFVDVRRLPEIAYSAAARRLLESDAVGESIRRLRAEPLVDYRAQYALQRRLLEPLAAAFFANAPDARRDAYAAFLREKPALRDYAVFRAATERRRSAWQSWESPARDGRLETQDFDAAAADLHAYAQFAAHEQLTELARHGREGGLGLYLDLPIGANLDSYDVWRERRLFALDVSTGAPPDPFFTRGQNWGFPPLLPEADRRQGYAYTLAFLRNHLAYAGVLRIDHVMALHRLFWVPRGMEATEGLYVYYRHEELYAMLLLESHRREVLLAGENLGTVPGEVNQAMADHRLQKLYVLQYELQPDPKHPLRPTPRESVASLNTHDMPPFAAYWRKRDVDERRTAGLLDDAGVEHERAVRAQMRAGLVRTLARKRYRIAADDPPGRVARAALEFLAAGPARLVLANLEDLWEEEESQNRPGTTTEHPNWRRKLRLDLETIMTQADIEEALGAIDVRRKRKSS